LAGELSGADKGEEEFMNRRDTLTLHDYNAWANTRVLGATEALAPEEFLRELRSSFPSVRDTLVHIVAAEWVWFRRWHGEFPSRGFPPTEFPTVDILRPRFDAIERERRAFLDRLSEERLVQPFTYRDLAGNQCTFRLVESLLHLVNHGTYHRGQITSMLRQLGAQPIPTDMNRLFLERAVAR
jgi:uncharacterized damage-inducible protein DinB